ncbi:MAG: ABC transporter permease [Spirochaetia bacterium]|jgi:ribose transport system permease protein
MGDARQRSIAMPFREVFTVKWLWSYIGAAFVFVVIAIVSSDPLGTLRASASFATFFMLVGIGQMLVITLGPGNIDLSIPYAIGLTGFVAMKVMNASDGGIALGTLAGLATGMAIGGFNFFLIRLLRVPPMISTLGSGFIVQSVSIVFFRGLQIKPPEGLAAFVNVKLGGVPLLFLVAIVIGVVMHIVLTRTRYGRFIHAIGQNARAASLAAINVERSRFVTYVLCGLFSGITGILLSAFGGGVTLGMGHEYLLNSIAVPVIGGSAIAGGNSNVPGILGASLLLILILYVLDILGFTVGLRYILTGVIILGIIFASAQARKAI